MLNAIPLTQCHSWQESLVNAVSDLPTLLACVQLRPDQLNLSEQAMKDFPLRVPLPYLNRIEPGNPQDPLLLQVLPVAEETLEAPGYEPDPLAEASHNPRPGLLQKYRGRALLLATSSCAIHCRYCFRRHFPYADNNPGRKRWQQTLEYLAADQSITEIILSGGDPLAIPDRQLQWLVAQVEKIPHVQRLRIHTRLPIMIPERVNQQLCAILDNTRLQSVMVLHSNHAREFDEQVDAACLRLRGTGTLLLNQSVLLHNINDSAHALKDLSERLLRAGVLPYYLHLPDKTSGTAHFDVSEASGRLLIQELQALLPGYLVPRLVREIPGRASKTLL